MKKEIAILGSTGSIGKASLNIIEKYHEKFNIFLLSANSNYTEICNQIIKFKPKFFIINNRFVFNKIKKKFKKKKLNFLIIF